MAMKRGQKSQEYAAGRVKDTVFVKDELNELLWAVGERDCGVVGEAATFLGLQRDKLDSLTKFNMTIWVLI